MPDRLEAKSKELMVLDTDNDEDKNLRLKGRQPNRCERITKCPSSILSNFILFQMNSRRPNDLHGQLENDYVSGNAGDARSEFDDQHGFVHKRFIYA